MRTLDLNFRRWEIHGWMQMRAGQLIEVVSDRQSRGSERMHVPGKSQRVRGSVTRNNSFCMQLSWLILSGVQKVGGEGAVAPGIQMGGGGYPIRE